MEIEKLQDIAEEACRRSYLSLDKCQIKTWKYCHRCHEAEHPWVDVIEITIPTRHLKGWSDHSDYKFEIRDIVKELSGYRGFKVTVTPLDTRYEEEVYKDTKRIVEFKGNRIHAEKEE